MATTSIREQIVSAIMTLLTATGLPPGAIVHRERTRPLENEDLPAIVVYFNEEEPLPITKQIFKDIAVERQLALMVECRAIATPPTIAPDQSLDPLIVWVTQQIMANEKFAGLAMGVTEGKTVWFSKEGDQPIAACVILFLIRFKTDRIDPTKQISGGLSS